MKKFFSLFLLFGFLSGTVLAEDKEKVIYKYRKYEKFDFDEIEVSGNLEGIGDLSVTPRKQKSFDNRLPYRKNFNPEIRKAIDTIR